MNLIDSKQLAEVPDLVAQLELPSPVETQLLDLVSRMAPSHGTRWLNVSDVTRSVHEDYPQLRPAYDAFLDNLDTPSTPFTFFWAGYHVLLTYRAASLMFPEHDFIPMGQAWVRAGVEKFFENPTYLMLRKAIGNDVGDLVEVMFRSNPFFNYGKQTVHREGPRTYTCYGTETYTEWVEILLVPFAEGMFEQFGVDGTTTFSGLSESSFEIAFEW